MSNILPIDHDLLESYVLGLASPEDCARVEALKLLMPAVGKEIQEIESSLEQLSMSYTRTPRPELRAQTWSAIQASLNAGSSHPSDAGRTSASPSHSSASSQAAASSSHGSPGILGLGYSHLFLGIVSVCAVIAAISYYRANTELQSQNTRLASGVATLEQQKLETERALNVTQRELEFRNSPFTHALSLIDLKRPSTIVARVYLNPNDTLRFVAMAGVCDAEASDHLILWSYYSGRFHRIHDCTLDAIGKLVLLESAPQEAQYLLTAESHTDSPAPNPSRVVAVSDRSLMHILLAKPKAQQEEFITGEPPQKQKQ